MKKRIIGLLLALIMMLSVMPTMSAAASIPQLSDGVKKTYQWTSSTDEYQLHLTVSKSGYYNISLNESLHKGALSLYIYDAGGETDTWYSIDTHGADSYQFSNVYLKSGRTYAVCLACYNDNYESRAAKVSILVKKVDHTPTLLSATAKSVVLKNNAFNLFRIHTNSAGDYLFTSGKNLSHLCVYDSKHQFLYDKDCDSRSNCLLTLDADTNYYVEPTPDCDIGTSGLSVKLRVAKTAKDVEKITVNSQLRAIRADEIYFARESLSTSLFNYKITYRDGSKAVKTCDDLLSAGIPLYINYAGTLQKLSDGTKIANAGKQSVTLSYLDGRTSSSRISVSSYLDSYSYLTPVAPKDICYIATANGREDTYYWRLKISSCGLYKISSDPVFSKALSSRNMKIFDENNKEVLYDSAKGGWTLPGKHEYIFRLQYKFASDYTGKVNFWFERVKSAHHYNNKVVAPTYTAKGYTKRTCSVCGHVYKNNYTDVKPLGQVKISSCYNARDGITLKWGKGTGATAYQVWRKTGSGDWKLLKTTTATSMTNTTVDNGVKYRYKVRAIAKVDGKIVNRGTYSPVRAKYRLIRPTLTADTRNIATRKIVVNWNGNAKATGYQIKYVADTVVRTVTVEGTDTLSKTISGLAKGVTYKVYVRSYKAVGDRIYYSAYSPYRSITIEK